MKQDVFSLKCLQRELCEVLMSPESAFVGAEEYKIENEKKKLCGVRVSERTTLL